MHMKKMKQANRHHSASLLFLFFLYTSPPSRPESRRCSLLMPWSISCLCFSVSSLRAFLSFFSSSTFLSSSPSRSSIVQGPSAPALCSGSADLSGPPSSGTSEVKPSVRFWGKGPMSDCRRGRQQMKSGSELQSKTLQNTCRIYPR